MDDNLKITKVNVEVIREQFSVHLQLDIRAALDEQLCPVLEQVTTIQILRQAARL